MTWAQFFYDSPILSILTILAVYYTIKRVCYVLPSRIVKGASIRKHGWPPAHCDADGDFKEEKSSLSVKVFEMGNRIDKLEDTVKKLSSHD